MDVFDVAVIGSGPGGYVAAIRAQQNGLRAVCIEKEKLGGVCLNWGCIPSKALLKAAEHAIFLKEEVQDFGFSIGEVTHDFAKVIARSRKIATQSEKGVQFLFKKYGVTHLSGTASIEAAPGAEPGRVRVVAQSGDQVVHARHIILATGARARSFPGMVPDGQRILTYREAIANPTQPASVVILGSGAIGCEFAYFYNAFGTKVTLVEGVDRIAPLEDVEISAELGRAFARQGITLKTGAFCERVEAHGDGVKVVLKDGVVLEAERCLLALGITPNTEGLGLEAVGVKLSRGGFVEHDSSFRTSIPGIYVVGDVAGPPALAHTAYAEAHVCIDRIAGKHAADVDYANMPAATYCQPQVASVGLTEAMASERGLEFTVGRFPFAANGKARGSGHTGGMVKVLVGKKYGEILGAHLIGHDVAELLPDFVMARSAEVTAEHFLHTVHAHPTLSEAMYEAVAVAIGQCSHI